MNVPGNFIKVAETGTANDMFAALDQMVQDKIGAPIFTCSTFDSVTRQAKRIYTNLPDVYPVSGLKDIHPNRWTKIVLDGHDTFVGNTIEEIAEVFPDHELIAELGCGSVVNMPVILAGTILGTVNLLNKAGHFDADRVEHVLALRPAAIISFAALPRS